MAQSHLLTLPDAALKRALEAGGPLVIVDCSIACRPARDAVSRLFTPDEMERVRIEAMCCAMAQDPESAIVQERACVGLGKHIHRRTDYDRTDYDRLRQIAEDAGAVRLIGEAMRRHTDREGLYYMAYVACCQIYDLLAPVARGNAQRTPSIWNDIKNAGIVESVVAIIETFAHRRTVMTQACDLLCLLTGEHRGRAGRCRRAVQAGAIEATVSVVYNNLDEDDIVREEDPRDNPSNVQYSACWLLANLANVNLARVATNPARLAMDAEAFEALVLAMQVHEGNENVMEEAGRALLNFVEPVRGGELAREVREAIFNAGGEAMIRSLRALERANPATMQDYGRRLAVWLEIEL